MSENVENKTGFVNSHNTSLDSEYVQWVHEIKERYRNAQIKAAVKVNSEQLLFNWQLGRDLVRRKAEERWGSGIVEQLSLDLQNEFPDAKGFSSRNLWNMKKWYSFYSSSEELDKQICLSSKQTFNEKKLHQIGAELSNLNQDEKLHQVGAEIPLPQIFTYVPWRHHVEIITKCKSIKEALFYIQKIVEEGWSRRTLQNCLDADMFHHIGNAVTNFDQILPENQSKLAQEITKDNYDLSFISLPKNYDETMLEEALEQNITRFLLELGTGFAFVGRQKEIIISGKSRKIDMLFYHINLKCYVVVELKIKAFEPEFAGKLNFYVNAVDELLKGDDDNPTIGLLICKSSDQTEVQWAFKGITTPLGVSSYHNIQIDDIVTQLPTPEQIQKQIDLAEEEFKLRKNQQEN